MATATAAFFEELVQRGFDPVLQSLTGTICFYIISEGSWWVTLKEGVFSVANAGVSADCVCVSTVEDFVSIAKGELNPFAAALQGRVQLAGDSALALITLRSAANFATSSATPRQAQTHGQRSDVSQAADDSEPSPTDQSLL